MVSWNLFYADYSVFELLFFLALLLNEVLKTQAELILSLIISGFHNTKTEMTKQDETISIITN